MSSTIHVRVDDELKGKVGTNTTTVIAVNGFPFEIKRASSNPYEALSEDKLLEKLEKSRESTTQGMYRDAADISGDMRVKYGLSK